MELFGNSGLGEGGPRRAMLRIAASETHIWLNLQKLAHIADPVNIKCPCHMLL